jgi:hypothetical protein
MTARHCLRVFGLAVLLGAGAACQVEAQQTRADTAAVLVQAARRLAAEGERDVAANLLRYIVRWYGDTPVAQDAARELAAVDRAHVAGNGRTSFVVTNTLLVGGGFGVLIPAMLGAEGPQAYGAGLILGPAAGLLGSLLYTRSYPITSGQAAAYRWSFVWLSWQSFLLWELADISSEVYSTLAIGGTVGIATGLGLTRFNLAAGDVALVQDASVWGTAYAAALSVLLAPDADPDETTLFGVMAGVGNASLLASIPLARAWRPSVGRVRLITLSGVAGGLMGGGIDLLADVNDAKTAVLIPTIGSAIGLCLGTVLTSRRSVAEPAGFTDPTRSSLLQLGHDPGIGLPLPEPRLLPSLTREGRIGWRPALGFRLAEVHF